MKKIMSILVSILILISCCGCTFDFIDNETREVTGSEIVSGQIVNIQDNTKINNIDISEIEEDNLICYKTLTDKQKKYYKLLYSISEKMPDGFINMGISDEMAQTDIVISYRAMLFDNPDIFWMPYSYIIGNNKKGNRSDILIAFNYNDDKNSCSYSVSKQIRDSKTKQLQKIVDSVIRNTKTLKTQYEKEKYINDFICNNTSYSLNSNLGATSYGCLVNGQAFCEGYSKAFKLLCTSVGIQCDIVCGECDNEGHMWNCVSIDNEWSYIDVTWNDQDETALKYIYFNISEEQVKVDHKIASYLDNENKRVVNEKDIFNFVKRNSFSNNNTYFYKSELLFDGDYGKTAEKIMIYNKSGKKEISLMFSDNTTKNLFEEDNKEILTKLQRKLKTIKLDKYIVTRDVLVLYWI